MIFAAWRTQIRLAAAVRLLVQQLPVGLVAHQVGYATPSAFVVAFKRSFGSNPGRYFF